ncbi:MAG: L-threonylcarbamoyladenylate synthase [bacterium]
MRMALTTMIDVKVVVVDYRQPSSAVIGRAVDLLGVGALVVAPTETQYGLLGRADRPEVVTRVYRVKGRPVEQPMAIFVDSLGMAAEYAEVNPPAQVLAARFLPGPLTLVLNRQPDWISPLAASGRVGIRISSAPVVRQIMARTNFPLTATSANCSGSPALTTIDRIRSGLTGGVDMFLDGGVLDGLASTVVDCSSGSPRILRPGAIGSDEIMAAWQERPA